VWPVVCRRLSPFLVKFVLAGDTCAIKKRAPKAFSGGWKVVLFLNYLSLCRPSTYFLWSDGLDNQNHFVLNSLWSVAYAENFHEGGSFIGLWWLFLFGVCCLWHHILTSYSCFQANVLAKLADTICIYFHTHSPYFMCFCIEYKLSALQVRISEENTLNATAQQFLSEKISGWALKQRSKTHSSIRQSIYNDNLCIKSKINKQKVC